MRIFWLESARDDLATIRRFIRHNNLEAAREVAQWIVAATMILAENPRAGRPGRWSGTRQFVILGTPYIAPYRVRARAIKILRVFHSAKKWPEQPSEEVRMSHET